MQKVSILCPIFNKSKYLCDTLYSIDQQFLSSDIELEVIGVDDKSTDNSADDFNKFAWSNEKIKTLFIQNSENVGPSLTLNKALSVASAELVIALDADDLLTRSSITHRVNSIQGGADWVIGDVLKMSPQGILNVGNEMLVSSKGNNWTGDELVDRIVSSRLILPWQGMMIKREIIERVGGWPTNMRSAQDFGMNLRLAVEGVTLYSCPHYVAVYRVPQKESQDSLFVRTLYSGQKVEDLTALKNSLIDKLNKTQLESLDKLITNYKARVN